MSDKANSNKREKIRVDFNTNIVLNFGSSEIRVNGSSKDISLNGVFINTKEDISIGTSCTAEIHLTGLTEDVAIKIQGKIARKDSKGIAVTFESMDLDSYTHLKNLVKYNTSNPDEVF